MLSTVTGIIDKKQYIMKNAKFTYLQNLFTTNPVNCELEHFVYDTDGQYLLMKDVLDISQNVDRDPGSTDMVTIQPKVALAGNEWKKFEFSIQVQMVRNAKFYPANPLTEQLTLFAGCGDWTNILVDSAKLTLN